MTPTARLRGELPLLIRALGVVGLFAALSTPYVVHGALQYTGTVVSQASIDASQASPPVSFYLAPGVHYYFYTVTQADTGETYAIVTTVSVPVGSRVYVDSSLAQWYINSASPPIAAGSAPYDRLIVAGSLRVVSPQLASMDAFLSGSGGAISSVSSVAPVIPFLLVLLVRLERGRWALWSVVLALWLEAMLPFAADVVGADYGQASSALLYAALVGLPILAYVTSVLEVQVRTRLAAKNNSDNKGPG